MLQPASQANQETGRNHGRLSFPPIYRYGRLRLRSLVLFLEILRRYPELFQEYLAEIGGGVDSYQITYFANPVFAVQNQLRRFFSDG